MNDGSSINIVQNSQQPSFRVAPAESFIQNAQQAVIQMESAQMAAMQQQSQNAVFRIARPEPQVTSFAPIASSKGGGVSEGFQFQNRPQDEIPAPPDPLKDPWAPIPWDWDPPHVGGGKIWQPPLGPTEWPSDEALKAGAKRAEEERERKWWFDNFCHDKPIKGGFRTSWWYPVLLDPEDWWAKVVKAAEAAKTAGEQVADAADWAGRNFIDLLSYASWTAAGESIAIQITDWILEMKEAKDAEAVRKAYADAVNLFNKHVLAWICQYEGPLHVAGKCNIRLGCAGVMNFCVPKDLKCESMTPQPPTWMKKDVENGDPPGVRGGGELNDAQWFALLGYQQYWITYSAVCGCGTPGDPVTTGIP